MVSGGWFRLKIFAYERRSTVLEFAAVIYFQQDGMRAEENLFWQVMLDLAYDVKYCNILSFTIQLIW